MMFNLQSEVIRRLAARESCVIIGRCADYVLRDVPGVTTIFLHGDMESRIKRVEEKRKLEKNQAVSLIKRQTRRGVIIMSVILEKGGEPETAMI